MAEFFKMVSGKFLKKIVLPLFNDIINGTIPIPADWKTAGLILIPKTTNPKPEEHRPISFYLAFSLCLKVVHGWLN